MCRNIKLLFNFEPPTSETEVQAAARQYVRKVTGMNRPSAANTAAFERAVADIAEITRRLVLADLQTQAEPRDRATEAARAKARGQTREARARAAPDPV
jgi:hypothetical protein